MRLFNYEITRQGITRVKKLKWRFNPKTKLSIVTRHKKIIETIHCPHCNTNGLKVIMLEEGNDGWDAKITCLKCKAIGILSNTGFHFEFQHGDNKK